MVNTRARFCVTVLMLAVVIFALPLVSASAQPGNPHPFRAPERGYGADPGDLSIAEVNALLEPCTEYARGTFPEAADRLETGLLTGARLFVISRTTRPFNQFYIEVDEVAGELIHGRMNSAGGMNVAGRTYQHGDSITLPVSEVFDWLIDSADRPEEGNLLGKYILRLDDGLVSGPCDPEGDELSRLRIYQPGYSFIPPDVEDWNVYGPTRDAEVTLQKSDESLDTVDTIFSVRYRARERMSETNQAFADYVERTEQKNLGSRRRYTLLEHEVLPYTESENRCVMSRQVIEDKEALRATGERTLMIREIMGLTCAHPMNRRVVVRVEYAHRHPVGQRNPEFIDIAADMFGTLAFSQPDRL